MGTRVEIELAHQERLSLRFPDERVIGGGTCDCETLAVQRRWESDGSRLVCTRGQVFRLAAREPST